MTDPNSPEARAGREADCRRLLSKYEGVNVDFSNAAGVRDQMEQTASSLACSYPAQKKAVSDYLHALQNPDIAPKELADRTRSLEQSFPIDTNKGPDANSRALLTLTLMGEGLTEHYNLDHGVQDKARSDAPGYAPSKPAPPSPG
jgi:hypothetical protein